MTTDAYRRLDLETVVRSAAGTILFLAVAVLLWPTSIGGRTAYVIVSGESMEPRYETMDLVVMRRTGAYDAGDLVTYRVPEGEAGAGHQVIHRIVGGDGATGYVTQGDNKANPDLWHPTDADVVGEEWFGVSGAGRWLLWLRQPVNFGALAAAIAVASIVARAGEDDEPSSTWLRARSRARTTPEPGET